jgi:acyl-CoA thioesterase FadM
MTQKAKFSITVRPMFGDEFRDSGVVHDLVYHIWSREAAAQYNRQLFPEEGEERPTPVKIEVSYFSPLLMTEEAKIYYRVVKIGRTSITHETQITEAASGRPVATIIYVGVMVDPKTGKAVPVPEEAKQILINFEGKENVEVK